MILSQIQKDLQQAQKAKDEQKVSSLRFLLSGLHNAEIAKGSKLSDEEVLDEISKVVKQHRESIEAFEQGMRFDLVTKEKASLAILQNYLPAQLSEDEIREIAKEIINKLEDKSIANLGKVIGMVMQKVKGRAEGAVVAEVVKKMFGESQS